MLLFLTIDFKSCLKSLVDRVSADGESAVKTGYARISKVLNVIEGVLK